MEKYKCIEILIQIQLLYNSLPIYEYVNLRPEFDKYINELKCTISLDQIDMINNMYNFRKRDFNDINANYEINENRMYYEQLALLSGQLIFLSPGIPYYKMSNDKYDGKALLEVLENFFDRTRAKK